VEITIHHLSGSRAGETQAFPDGAPLRIGRSPETEIRFDAQKELVVSAVHAEITADGQNLVIRDLQSRNGTFVGSERITEKRLAPGDLVQLGMEGPKLRVDFAPQAGYIPETVIIELPKITIPVVRRTQAIPLPAESRPQVEAPRRVVPPAAAPRRSTPKKKNPLRALLIVFGVLFVLVAAAVIGAFMIRQANLRKRAQVAAARQQDVTHAEQVQAAIAKQSAQVAAQVTKIAEVQSAPEQTSTESIEDLKRQLEDSRHKLEQQQGVEDELTHKLQQTNDELASAKTRPPKVRYVPAQRPAASAAQPSAPQLSAGSEAPSATGRTQSQGARSQGPAASTRAGDRAAPATTANAPNTSAAPLYAGRQLLKKVAVTTAPSPVALANLPASTGRDLASVLAAALESTGKFVSDARAPASVSIAVTNFRWDTATTDPTRAVNNASRLGRLFGKPLPDNPVDTRTTSSDAMLSLKVNLYDQAGRQLAEVQPEAEASSRKSSLAVGGVPFKQVINTDTPLGDVIRKVVSDAVDGLTPALQRLDWTAAVVVQQQQGTAILAAGRNSGVQIGDVFDVTDTAGRAGARVRVLTVAPDTATAEVLSISTKKLGSTAKFVGSETAPQPSATDRWLITRAKTPALEGPGNSFKTVKTFNPNARLKFEYSVGSWAKVTDSGSSYWVLVSSGRIIG
jgi:pSer/pThr/pTyr-binding forkhead associated (FHA) protein